jgi:hypothetical protein
MGVAGGDDKRMDECRRPAGPVVFAWNHHRIMRWGGEGAARRIGCRLVAAS